MNMYITLTKGFLKRYLIVSIAKQPAYKFSLICKMFGIPTHFTNQCFLSPKPITTINPK